MLVRRVICSNAGKDDLMNRSRAKRHAVQAIEEHLNRVEADVFHAA